MLAFVEGLSVFHSKGQLDDGSKYVCDTIFGWIGLEAVLRLQVFRDAGEGFSFSGSNSVGLAGEYNPKIAAINDDLHVHEKISIESAKDDFMSYHICVDGRVVATLCIDCPDVLPSLVCA